MRITKLTLTNFRNYAHCEFAPEGGINLIVGENAQGKTNLLEAVFFCCFGRSHRTSREKDLIAYDEAFARIRLESVRTETAHDLRVRLSREEGRKIHVDGAPLSRIGELMGLNTCVLFAPEHLSIVKDGPAERRRFLDMELSQTYPAYFFPAAAVHARPAPAQHAAALPCASSPSFARRSRSGSSSSRRWALRSCAIARSSARAFRAWPRRTTGTSAAGANPSPWSTSRTCEAGDEASLLRALEAARPEDLRRCTTTRGVHRDEMALTLDGREIRALWLPGPAAHGRPRPQALGAGPHPRGDRRVAHPHAGRRHERTGRPPASATFWSASFPCRRWSRPPHRMSPGPARDDSSSARAKSSNRKSPAPRSGAGDVVFYR